MSLLPGDAYAAGLRARRPLVASTLNRSQGTRRRQPLVRPIPEGGPVLLKGLERDGDARLIRGGDKLERVPGAHPQKQALAAKGAGLGEAPRSGPLPARPPIGSSQAGSSWQALRRVLHERYRDYEERGAAEDSAVEAARRGRGRGGGGDGEVLSPGLR